jgi:hypothetical protein
VFLAVLFASVAGKADGAQEDGGIFIHAEQNKRASWVRSVICHMFADLAASVILGRLASAGRGPHAAHGSYIATGIWFSVTLADAR